MAARELPWNDPAVDALPSPLRHGLATYWSDRAAAELRVSMAFRILEGELAETGTSAVVLRMVARTIEDEVRHAELCRRLASRYAGHDVAAPTPEPVSLPAYPGVSPTLRTALHVMGLSCINETIATVWLRGCLTRAKTPLARAANRVHLREEISHARLGWAHLASRQVSAETRARLAESLGRLLAANVPQWFRPDRSLPVTGVPDYGAPSVETTKAIVLGAVRDVVLPGFAEVGIEPSLGQAWLTAQGHALAAESR